jgi:pimeloyl-ACP methyl ester carboxylesterase
VTFNGRTTAPDEFHNPASLLGEDGKWSLTAIDIDIRNVKFPEKGVNGAEPTPAINQIQIDVDTTFEAFPLFCIEGIDWVALHFKTVSPIVLIHGNGSNPGFWDRHSFSDDLYFARWSFEGCGAAIRDCDYPVELETGAIDDNAKSLDDQIPRIATALGVNSLHLVAHSKGGLDAREYLASYQPKHDDQFHVLSYTSLSTPHNGSPGADLSWGLHSAVLEAIETRFINFPLLTQYASEYDVYNEGRRFLTTEFLQDFNLRNQPLLVARTKTKYWQLFAADADRNFSGTIDQLIEWSAMKLDEPALASRSNLLGQWAMNKVYQFLRTTSVVVIEPFGFGADTQR